RKADNWYLLSMEIPVSQATTIQVYCKTSGSTCTFDDFRVHPYQSPVTGYVYNKWGELAYILDNNNLYTEYRYDDMGRLIGTYKVSLKTGSKKIGEVIYHHANN